MTISKLLHFVWVGDQSRRPDDCIESWRRLNPNYDVIIWDNDAFAKTEWHNIQHIYEMIPRELNGVADMMRYEILYQHGGIALDADSYCLRPLEDWLLEPNEFACWENELLRPGLIACGAMGSIKNSPFFGQIIKDIALTDSVVKDLAWKTVGPLRLTEAWKKYHYPLTIYPSHYFLPNHFSGEPYKGAGPVFADQVWGSTRNAYISQSKSA